MFSSLRLLSKGSFWVFKLHTHQSFPSWASSFQKHIFARRAICPSSTSVPNGAPRSPLPPKATETELRPSSFELWDRNVSRSCRSCGRKGAVASVSFKEDYRPVAFLKNALEVLELPKTRLLEFVESLGTKHLFRLDLRPQLRAYRQGGDLRAGVTRREAPKSETVGFLFLMGLKKKAKRQKTGEKAISKKIHWKVFSCFFWFWFCFLLA